ncbi:MAG: PAS domain S-box protein [Rhodocyclaceae bacterium]|nr:PAS domain S-box protein [Rhodocyclaceae bacterium]
MRDTSKIRTAWGAGWLWLLPRIAFVLFVAAVGALLWLSERTVREEQRAILISDVLWLEQDLRFQLSHNEELLGQIGPREAATPEIFEAHARTLLANKAGLRQILWLNADNEVKRIFPGFLDAAMVGEGQNAIPAPETLRLARSLGNATYSPAYPIVDGDWQFEVHVPVFRGGRLAGVTVGLYSVRHILNDAIPWWLAERYRISVIDTTGNHLGDRSKVEAAEDVNGYEIPFEPPGNGLSLHTAPYRTPAPLAGRLLGAALVLLAVIVLWSLWALRRHVQHRQLAEAALRTEHAFRKAMEDSLQTGMRARDLTGRITYVNPAFCRMVGWSADELVGRAPPMPYWPDEYFNETRNMHDRILAGQGPEDVFELKFKRSNGERFDVLIHEAPLIDAHGKQTGWMGSLIDVTERKRAEELAQQQQERLQATARLVAMGEMASSLAHELNQPLAAIASYNTGCLNMLESGSADPAELKAALAKSAAQAQRAGRVIRRIYEFVRRAEPKSEPCDLAEIVDEVLNLVDADARRLGVRIESKAAATLPHLQGDRVLIAQALLNLVRNAIDAMRALDKDRRVLTVAATAEGDAITVAIADRGCGISPAAASRLFEPFYTTKPEGMGMGLNICRSVVEAHHGRLWYEPNPDGGSIFRIRFPLPPP